MTMHERTGRLVSLLREFAATFIRKEANASPLITVTGIDLSSDFRRTTIRVSVFPEAQQESALIFLKRKRGAFRSFIKQQARLKEIPSFDFAVDSGEKNRQMLDALREKHHALRHDPA